MLASQELANERAAKAHTSVNRLGSSPHRRRAGQEKVHISPSWSSLAESKSNSSTSEANDCAERSGGFFPIICHGLGSARSVHASGTAKVPPLVPWRMTVSTPPMRRTLSRGNR